jgi:hypothetical protein
MLTAKEYQILDAIEEYNNINNKLNHLFEVKYSRNGRFSEYIYYGYLQFDYEGPKSEDYRFLLVDTVNQTWGFESKLDATMEFLGLTEEEKEEFRKDISELAEKENKLRKRLKENNSLPSNCYERKLFVLQVAAQ